MQQPIIGADFLKSYNLVVNMDASQLLDLATMQRFGLAVAECGSSFLANVLATPKSFRDLFTEFQDMVNCSWKLSDAKHGVEHVLETTVRAVTAKFHRLNQDKMKAAKAEFLKMEVDGIICGHAIAGPVPSTWSRRQTGHGSLAGATDSST
jgi:hypothetical protein